MKAVFLRGFIIVMAASAAACTTPLGGGGDRGVEVTRFHLDQPIARSSIAVEPVDAADRNSLEFAFYRFAVERQLARLGWNVVQTAGQPEQIALIDVDQGSREAIGQGSGVSVGVGGGTGGWGRSGVGVGANVGFPLGGSSRELVSTMLEVSIRRRSDQTVFWEGRAIAEARAGTREADPRAVMERLAEALFRDFPGESGRTIRVG